MLCALAPSRELNLTQRREDAKENLHVRISGPNYHRRSASEIFQRADGELCHLAVHTDRFGGDDHNGLGSLCNLSRTKDLGFHAGTSWADASRTMGIAATNRRWFETADQRRLHS